MLVIKKIGLPLRGRPILLSLVRLPTELDSTQTYYHYLLREFLNELLLEPSADYLKVFVCLSSVRTPSMLIPVCLEMVSSFRSRRQSFSLPEAIFPRFNSVPARKPDNMQQPKSLLSQWLMNSTSNVISDG